MKQMSVNLLFLIEQCLPFDNDIAKFINQEIINLNEWSVEIRYDENDSIDYQMIKSSLDILFELKLYIDSKFPMKIYIRKK